MLCNLHLKFEKECGCPKPCSAAQLDFDYAAAIPEDRGLGARTVDLKVLDAIQQLIATCSD